jgi:hypothetical protein
MSSPQPGPRAQLVRGILVDLAIMTVIGVVLALIGPFGSIALPLARRLIMWLGYAYIGYLFYRPVWPVADLLARRLHLPRIGLMVAGCLLATVPAATAMWIVEFLPGPIPAPTVEEAFATYLNVLIIGASIMVVFHLINRNRAGPQEPMPAPPAQDRSRPRFLDRLPPELGTELVALEMEDHYVRAHTMLGSDLVLLRLRDAIVELDGIEGEQVHRSWWVARGAVEDVEREGRNVRLVLARGIAAPVSRANVQRLKDAGWF